MLKHELDHVIQACNERGSGSSDVPLDDLESAIVQLAHDREQPVPMIITCPIVTCAARHIDKGKFATKPHHTHSCQACGHTWRPALVATVGVQFLPGFKDEEGGA